MDQPPAHPDLPQAADSLAKRLAGDLPCARCRYNLRSLSITEQCPECGLPVLTTILGVVDPRAGELQPLRMPLLIASGLILWTTSALLAASLTWWLTLANLAAPFHIAIPVAPWAPIASVVAIAVSGAASLVLIRPHQAIALSRSLLTLLASLLYVPLALVHARIHLGVDASTPPILVGADTPSLHRVLLRIVAGVLIIAIAILLRPNARLLAARSLTVRIGRVDRQSMNALAAAVAIALVGDLVHLPLVWLGPSIIVLLLGSAIIGVGSLLLTMGLVGLVLDSIRVAPILISPGPGVEQVLGRSPPHP